MRGVRKRPGGNKKEYDRTLDEHERLKERLRKAGEEAIGKLPIGFLKEYKLKTIAHEKGSALIRNHWLKIIRERQRFALIVWKKYVQKLVTHTENEALKEHIQLRQSRHLVNISDKFIMKKQRLAFRMWSAIVTKERVAERYHAACVIQRFFNSRVHSYTINRLTNLNQLRARQRASIRIQTWYRNLDSTMAFANAVLLERTTNAACKIQRFWRYVTIQARKMGGFKQYKLFCRQWRAATVVGKYYRRYRAKEFVNILRAHTNRVKLYCRIQAFGRGIVAKHEVRNRRAAEYQIAAESTNFLIDGIVKHVAVSRVAKLFKVYRKRQIQTIAWEQVGKILQNARLAVAATKVQRWFRHCQIANLVWTLTTDTDAMLMYQATKIQSLVRQALAKNTATVLRAEWREKSICMVKIQRHCRSFLAKREYRQRRRAARVIADSVERLRTQQLRRRLASRVLQRCRVRKEVARYNAFHGFVEGSRIAISEREKDNNMRAQKFYIHQTLRKSTSQWISYWRSRCRKNLNTSKARAASNRMLSRRIFKDWRDVTIDTISDRHVLVSIFLQCVPISAWNSSRQLEIVSQTADLERKAILRHYWRERFEPFMEYRHEQEARAIAHYKAHEGLNLCDLLFQTWHVVFVPEEKRRKQTKKLSGEFCKYLFQRRSFAALLDHKEFSLYYKAINERAKDFNELRLEQLGVNMMKFHVVLSKEFQEMKMRAHEFYNRNLKEKFIKGLREGAETVKYWKEMNQRATFHHANFMIRFLFLKWARIAHAIVANRLFNGALKIQCMFRQFRARDRFRKRLILHKYQMERRRAIEKAMKQERRDVIPYYDGQDLTLVDISIIFLLAPFAKPTGFERAIYKALQREGGRPQFWAAYRVSLNVHGTKCCLELGAKQFPSIKVLWRGGDKYPSKAVQPLLDYFKNGVGMYDDADHAAHEFLGALVEVLEKTSEEEQVASNKLQIWWHAAFANFRLRRWRKLVKDVKADQQRLEEERRWVLSKDRRYKSKKGRWFYFDHEALKSSWDPPLPPNDHPITFLVILRTGHRIRISHLKNSSSLTEIVEWVSLSTGLPATSLTFFLRPEGIWCDRTVVAGYNNRGMRGRLGVGAKNVEAWRDGTWHPCTIVRVYPDESANVQFEGEPQVFRVRRDRMRIQELVMDERRLDDVGIVDESVFDVVETIEAQPANDVTLLYGVLCMRCDTAVCEVKCNSCKVKQLTCKACFMKYHSMPNPKGKTEPEPQDDETDPESLLSEYDRHLLARQRVRHVYQPIDIPFIAQCFSQSLANAEITKKRQKAPDVPILCGICELAEGSSRCETCEQNYCTYCFRLKHSHGRRYDHCMIPKPEKPPNHSEPLRVNAQFYESRGFSCKWMIEEAERIRVEDEAIRNADMLSAQEIICEAFEKYDRNGDGSLDALELEDLFRNELCEPVTKEQIEEAIRKMDIDGDGTIQFNELLAWFVDLQKQEGRDSTRMRLLRLNLLAKKRARILSNQISSKMPKEKITRLKSYLDEQAQRWKDWRPLVPGQTHARQITIGEFENNVHLFQRYTRLEFGIGADLMGDVFKRRNPKKIERIRLAFESTFMPVFNSGKLGAAFYNDNRHIEHENVRYRQFWDDIEDIFKYQNLNTGENLDVNPILREKYLEPSKIAFEKYDADHSGNLSDDEIKNLLEEELCMKVSQEVLDKTMKQIDYDGTGNIDFDKFFRWYMLLVECGTISFSTTLFAKKKIREIQQKGAEIKGTISKATVDFTQRAVDTTMRTMVSKFQVLKTLAIGKKSVVSVPDLVAQGWKKEDIQKALIRCKTVDDDEKAQAVLDWLRTNAIQSTYSVYN